MLASNVAFLQGAQGYYGETVGTTPTTVDTLTNGKAIGITLDPAKSGIITSKDSSKHLFFFVN